MNTDYQIARIFDIPIKFHWSFIFIVFFIVYLSFSRELEIYDLSYLVLGIVGVFICVLLHEFGHALMAKKYKIPIVDILITPLGGLARFSRVQKVEENEIVVAFAGPLVNLVLSCILLVPFAVDGKLHALMHGEYQAESEIWRYLYLFLNINIVLFVFNLIPAFPMDGGRILRGILTRRLDRLKATYIAMVTGKIFASIFVIIAFTSQMPVLFFIGLFVYYMADVEYNQMELQISKSANEDHHI